MLLQTGTRAFVTSFKEEYYLLKEKWKNPQYTYYEYGLVIIYYGKFLTDLVIEYTHSYLKKNS